jgi:hypothetical protein
LSDARHITSRIPGPGAGFGRKVRQVGKVKPPAGAVSDARRSNRLPLLTAYRLPVFVQRPPFSVTGCLAHP